MRRHNGNDCWCEVLGSSATTLEPAVVLLRMGFVGPSHAILRMCRESVVSMLFLAFADESEAERFIRFVTVKLKVTQTFI